MTGNFLFLFIILYRKLAGFPLKYLVTGCLKVLLAALAMGGWLLALGHFSQVRVASGSIVVDMCMVAIAIVSGAAVYGVVLYQLGLPELQLIVGRMKERFSG
jgi:peptidoglycan biosynthesis protein MviN/MurJ (putative lipid II flippase)